MHRRDLFRSGYSLMVLAGGASGTAAGAPPQARAAAREPVLEHLHTTVLTTDILVAGGGLAGVCAAVAAARTGAKVILVQDRSRLGGNSSSEVKMHVVGANSHKGRPGWRETGLIEEFRLDDAAGNPQRCWEMWDLLLYDKVISEPNITLLLESTLFAVEMDGTQIRRAFVRCDRSEQMYDISARLFVDATGDSRLALEAGADMRSGREARGEFGESLAPEKADGETLGSSILFTSRLHRRAMPFHPPKWARKVTKDQLKHRGISSWEYGYWWIEWGGDRDIIRENEKIRFELLSIVMGVWDYIKNSGDFPESANYALDWVGMMPGKRGSRRILGDHILTQNDLMSGGNFPDAVAIGGWPMDDHPPGGFDRSDLPPNTVLRTPEPYNIPLRALYSRNIPNLLMAGRNISATHAAFTSTRVMATCAAIGQAAGTCAAICVEAGSMPRDVARDSRSMAALQCRLLRDDATIRGLPYSDPADVARLATVSCSSFTGEGRPERVTDGVLRDLPGKPPEIHHWEASLAGGPAHLDLAWPAPQRIRSIQLTFDTGLHRELTLTASEAIHRGIVRGPQPETVRDYAILYRTSPASPWRELLRVQSNYQRVNRHRFDAVEAAAVRLVVEAANGDDKARVFGVSCYG